eukprot:RCo013399
MFAKWKKAEEREEVDRGGGVRGGKGVWHGLPLKELFVELLHGADQKPPPGEEQGVDHQVRHQGHEGGPHGRAGDSGPQEEEPLVPPPAGHRQHRIADLPFARPPTTLAVEPEKAKCTVREPLQGSLNDRRRQVLPLSESRGKSVRGPKLGRVEALDQVVVLSQVGHVGNKAVVSVSQREDVAGQGVMRTRHLDPIVGDHYVRKIGELQMGGTKGLPQHLSAVLSNLFAEKVVLNFRVLLHVLGNLLQVHLEDTQRRVGILLADKLADHGGNSKLGESSHGGDDSVVAVLAGVHPQTDPRLPELPGQQLSDVHSIVPSRNDLEVGGIRNVADFAPVLFVLSGLIHVDLQEGVRLGDPVHSKRSCGDSSWTPEVLLGLHPPRRQPLS